MHGNEFINVIREVQGNNSFPIKIIDSDGNILGIDGVSFSGLNGGEIHVRTEDHIDGDYDDEE